MRKSFYIFVLLASISACKKDPVELKVELPTVTTAAINNIISTSASGGGNITSDGGSAITARGICWSKTSSPTISNTHTSDGTGIGQFNITLTGLVSGTTYYVRAYATNEAGTAYGNEVTFTTSDPDVYVSGTTIEGGKLWKNGIEVLSVPAADFYSLYISGSDVYIAGLGKKPDDKYYAMVWKNGVSTAQSDKESSYAMSVFVSGNDVYVSGDENATATTPVTPKIWKNGIPMPITAGAKASSISSVFVSGNDVYAGGFIESPSGIFTGTTWKNGVPNIISTRSCVIRQVVFANDTLYAVGSEENVAHKTVAKIWKNGVETALSNGTNNSAAICLAVSGTTVYVGGFETNTTGKSVATIWRNNSPGYLTTGVTSAGIKSLAINGSDIYATGYENNASNQRVPKVWKNGVPSILAGNIPGSGNSIFVK